MAAVSLELSFAKSVANPTGITSEAWMLERDAGMAAEEEVEVEEAADGKLLGNLVEDCWPVLREVRVLRA